MTENVVKDVRLGQIIKLALRTDKGACWKPSIGEMIEKRVVRDQPGDRHDAPPRKRPESFAQLLEVGNSGARQFELLLGDEKGVAGAARQEPGLARIKPVPAIVLLACVGRPILVDRPIGLARRVSVAVLFLECGHGHPRSSTLIYVGFPPLEGAGTRGPVRDRVAR